MDFDDTDQFMGNVLLDFDSKPEKPKRPSRIAVTSSFTQRMSSSFASPAPKRARKSFGGSFASGVNSENTTGVEPIFVENRDRADSMASILSDSE